MCGVERERESERGREGGRERERERQRERESERARERESERQRHIGTRNCRGRTSAVKRQLRTTTLAKERERERQCVCVIARGGEQLASMHVFFEIVRSSESHYRIFYDNSVLMIYGYGHDRGL